VAPGNSRIDHSKRTPVSSGGGKSGIPIEAQTGPDNRFESLLESYSTGSLASSKANDDVQLR
ncbi:MAG TPA: hypothetical protein VHP35_09440, partial [Terriglobia bacterium]|nr:hypothetical protein [Terriglobia bacterium]